MTRPDEAIPYQLEAHIVTAFTQARNRGKPDWRRMAISVLKNRLLQQTRRAFSERLHDAASMQELLARYPALVKLDGEYVELLADVPDLRGAPPQPARIRSDLWRAVMDFRSGKKYAWDAGEGGAREARSDDERILPTVGREEFGQWRGEFVTAHSDRDLASWRDQAQGTQELPEDLRREWSAFVASKVAHRLTDWFQAQSIPLPSLAANAFAPTRRGAEPSVERLREVILACVAVMTREELSALTLPPEAVLRAKLGGKL